MTLEALKLEIDKLSKAERALLSEWLADREEKAWDAQIAADFDAGKLDRLINRAEREANDGTIRESP